MDRSSTIDRINQKYLGVHRSSIAPPSIVRTPAIIGNTPLIAGPTVVAGVTPNAVVTERHTVTTIDPPAVAPIVDVHASQIPVAHHTPAPERITPRGGGLCEGGRICGCPWWLCLLLALLGLILLGVAIGFITGLFGNKQGRGRNDGTGSSTETDGEVKGGTA